MPLVMWEHGFVRIIPIGGDDVYFVAIDMPVERSCIFPLPAAYVSRNNFISVPINSQPYSYLPLFF